MPPVALADGVMGYDIDSEQGSRQLCTSEVQERHLFIYLSPVYIIYIHIGTTVSHV